METWRVVGIVVCSVLLVPITIGFVWSLRMYLRIRRETEKKP